MAYDLKSITPLTTFVPSTGFLFGANDQSSATPAPYTGTSIASAMAASTDTLTNKTFDTAGTGNTFKINGVTITDKTGTGKVVLDTSPVLGSIELGNATDTTIARVSAAVISVEGNTILTASQTATLTVGYTATSFSLGTLSSGTTTLATANGGKQHATNGGAFALAPQATVSTIEVEITNNGSAGAITPIGYDKVVGSFDTTNTHAFQCISSVSNTKKVLYIQGVF